MSERKPLHFDSLPDSATEYIVSLLLPESKSNEDWSNQFSLDTIVALIKSGGSLRRVAKNAFRTVQFSVGKNAKQKKNAVQVRGKHKDVNHLLKALPICIGEGIETMFVSALLSSSFTTAIAKHCTGLRRLSFKPLSGRNFPNVNFCKIIAARGPGLEFLDISDCSPSEVVVAAITEHCRNQVCSRIAPRSHMFRLISKGFLDSNRS